MYIAWAIYHSFLDKNFYFKHKISVFLLFVLSHASNNTSDNTTSPNIGGTDAWVVPHFKFWGERTPVSPRSPPMGQGYAAPRARYYDLGLGRLDVNEAGVN